MSEVALIEQDDTDIIPPKPTDVAVRADSRLEWNGEEWKSYTTKQLLFVDCFMHNGYKAAKAYKDAGYDGNSPKRDCHAIYHTVVDLIAYRTRQVAKKVSGGLNPEIIMAKLARAIDMGMGDTKVVLKFDPSLGALVPETDHEGNVCYKADVNAAIKGLEVAGKAFGMWIDKIKVDNGIDDLFLSRLTPEQAIQLDMLIRIGNGELVYGDKV